MWLQLNYCAILDLSPDHK